jgi:spore maturation protein SpmA
VINAIWFGLIVVAVAVAGVTDLLDPSAGRMAAVTKASMDSAKSAVELAIGLVGVMTFWLGVMKVAEAGGLLNAIARALKPVMVRLFPDVPPEHPAMGAMLMNLSANVLGLGNAATPFGIKAMAELDSLNRHKGVATDAMCLFLAINTSGVSLLPLGVIAVRQAAGSTSPASILGTTLFATACSTVVAVILAKSLSKLPRYRLPAPALPAIDNGTMTGEDG